MNGHKPNPIGPALIGGAVAGILSGIPIVNCLCCLWIIGGAMLASYLLSKNYPAGMTAGDGALVGAFTGIFAAVFEAIVAVPFQALNAAFFRKVLERLSEYTQEMPAGWDTLFKRGAGPFSIAWFFLGLVVSAAIFAALGALGGIIGASLFGKKTPPPAAGTPHETPQDPSHRQS